MKINNTSITSKNIEEKVTLHGWVSKKRDLGSLVFIDLRDRSGIIQLLFAGDLYEKAKNLKNETVIKVVGIVRKRENPNDHLITGEIEIEVQELLVLNESSELPFDLINTTALEDTRLKYRYLDLRKDELKNNLIMKHKIMQATRSYLNDNEFLEIETPILCKSTPEGARDYLVPSRVNRGTFYALPQSPQIFKQLLMVSGFEKYYQIARCFRDEDLRADRQPEFTQIDLEMSFVNEEDIMNITEGLVSNIFKQCKNIDIELPLPRLTYKEAMDRYGSDKPDTRFDMELKDITEAFVNTDFTLFQNIINQNGIINCLVVKNKASDYSRKNIDALQEFVKTYRADALAFLKYDEEITGSIAKFVTEEVKNKLEQILSLDKNDLILIVAGNRKIVKNALGQLRLKLGKELNLINEDKYNLLWVTDFPMFEYSEEENRYIACHHPFTHPQDVNNLDDKQHTLARAYDIVLNGYEIGGGSIRIHDPKVQKQVLKSLSLSETEIEEKFGFLTKALTLGAPPHGGLALGLERLTMILCNTDNIRNVIAFPKTASASCLLTEAPNIVSDKQLDELGIKIL